MSTMTETRPTSSPRARRPKARRPRARRRTTAPGWPHPPLDSVVAPERPRRSPVRLTRRGRWTVTILILATVLALSVAVGSRVGAAVDPGVGPVTTTVVVAPGESLWSIASEVSEPGETRDLMYEIERLNQLEDSTLVPGQRLLVPAP